MPAYEVEAKYPLSDAALIRRQLAALGAVAGSPLAQCDTYFAHPARDFAQTDEAFRLRCVGDQNALTYKGPLIDRQTKTREEIEIPIAPGAAAASQMKEMLRALGFRAVRSVEKTRQPFHLSWQKREFELALDTVEGLGEFLEIETQADVEQWEAARDDLLALAAALGLQQSERRSYLQLLLERDSGVAESTESRHPVTRTISDDDCFVSNDDNRLQSLLDFLAQLERAKIYFCLERSREDAIMVRINVPGEHWEVEFFPDGEVEVERFKSTAQITSGLEAQELLQELFAKYSD